MLPISNGEHLGLMHDDAETHLWLCRVFSVVNGLVTVKTTTIVRGQPSQVVSTPDLSISIAEASVVTLQNAQTQIVAVDSNYEYATSEATANIVVGSVLIDQDDPTHKFTVTTVNETDGIIYGKCEQV